MNNLYTSSRLIKNQILLGMKLEDFVALCKFLIHDLSDYILELIFKVKLEKKKDAKNRSLNE